MAIRLRLPYSLYRHRNPDIMSFLAHHIEVPIDKGDIEFYNGDLSFWLRDKSYSINAKKSTTAIYFEGLGRNIHYNDMFLEIAFDNEADALLFKLTWL